MIGIRSALSGIAAMALAGGVLAPAAPNPAAGIAARRLVVERASTAIDRLDELDRLVEAAVASARRGAARVVSGAEPPGPSLTEAAAVLAGAEDAATEARRAIRAADGAQRALDPAASGSEPALAAGEVGSIGTQLEATVPAAESFAQMRRRAEALVGGLDAALEALVDGDPAEADRLATAARTDHDAISAWEVELVTLPVWIATTDALVGDVETLVAATRAGDSAAAEAAAEAFATRGEEAATADRALRIAMSEGGAAVTAPPLGRLATLRAAIRDERLRMDALRLGVSP
jgi:hypothetical protein